MNKSNKRPASRKLHKDSRTRSRKGFDESEKLITGAGWTQAATQHFLELDNDEARMKQVKAMLNISDDDYKFQLRSTYQADFSLANGFFCIEQQFSMLQTQFVCRSLTSLFEIAVASYKEDPTINVDNLRQQLMTKFQTFFEEFNTEDYKFTPEQTEVVLKYISTTFIRPIRLILHSFSADPYVFQFYEPRKIFQPPQMLPLSDFVENFPLPEEEEQFNPPELPKLTDLHLLDVKDAVTKYTESVLKTIEARYDRLENSLVNLGNNA